jgi:hypothetical protein
LQARFYVSALFTSEARDQQGDERPTLVAVVCDALLVAVALPDVRRFSAGARAFAFDGVGVFRKRSELNRGYAAGALVAFRRTNF